MNEYDIVKNYYEKVCLLAENNMIKIGKLEGSHYAAMKTILEGYRTGEYGSGQNSTLHISCVHCVHLDQETLNCKRDKCVNTRLS